MAAAVFADGDAGVGGSDLDIQLWVADGVADLVVSATSCKNGEGARKWHLTGGCKTSGDAHHVLLGDAHIKKAFRKFLLEEVGLGRFRQVCIEDDDVFIGGAEGFQRLTVCFACCLFFHLTHPPLIL